MVERPSANNIGHREVPGIAKPWFGDTVARQAKHRRGGPLVGLRPRRQHGKDIDVAG